jgi:hypothetical protein
VPQASPSCQRRVASAHCWSASPSMAWCCRSAARRAACRSQGQGQGQARPAPGRNLRIVTAIDGGAIGIKLARTSTPQSDRRGEGPVLPCRLILTAEPWGAPRRGRDTVLPLPGRGPLGLIAQTTHETSGGRCHGAFAFRAKNSGAWAMIWAQSSSHAA